MSVLVDLISTLTKGEQQDFVRFLANRNKRSDTRNTALFRELASRNEGRIKQEIGSNAYNVLKKRLSDSLQEFVAGNTFKGEVTDEISVIKQIMVARKLFVHENHISGFKVLKKAETAAYELQHYSLLNEIYHTYVEYSYHTSSPNQEEIFEKFEINKSEFLHQERLNMAYAAIRKAFHAIEYHSEDIDLKELIQENFDRFNIPDDQRYSFKTLYHIAQIADITGAYSKDYYSVDIFFAEKVQELKGGPGDTEKFLNYHIDVLYMIANIYFRKKDFTQSARHLEEMHVQMKRFDRRYYYDFYIRYANLKSLNSNFTDDYAGSLELLNELIDSGKYKEDQLYNPLLALAMIRFQQEDLNAVKQIISKFHRSDLWYERKNGREWTLQLKYIEILLYIELGEVDFVDARITSLMRKYGDLFKSDPNNHVLSFLKCVKAYYHEPSIATTDEFKERVEGSIKWKPVEQEDIFLMCFYAWLKSKMDGTPIYSTTLDLVRAKYDSEL
ncbi:MAG: hypothetical protein QNK23_10140 [Crocinitomicaceae bacterium]|nr:hypothetical protein [Crocinitomicaceae bacterium]